MAREYTAEFKLEAVKLANEQRKVGQPVAKVARDLKCKVPECDGMIKYEKKIPSKEELWDKYYMGEPKQHRRFVEQYKIEKRA